jgi:tape measure domain-containing protein
MNRLGASDLSNINKQLASINKNISNMNTSTVNAVANMKTLAISAGAALTGIFAGSAFTRAGDSLTSINNRLSLIVGRGQELGRLRTELERISLTTKTSINSGAEVFGRIGLVLKERYPTEDLLAATEAIQLAAKIGGGAPESVDAALVQLSQAFAGNFQNAGAELTSLQEQAPKVALAIAEGLNIPYGELKKLAADGKLNSDIVLNALIAQLGSLREEANLVESTVSGSFNILSESFSKFFGEVNAGLGTNKRLTSWMESLADSMYYLSGYIREDVEDIVSYITNFVSEIYSSVTNFYNNFGKPIVDTFISVVTSVYSYTKGLWSRIADPVVEMLENIKQVIWDFGVWLIWNSVWKDIWEDVIAYTANLWSMTKQVFFNFVNNIKGVFERLRESISSIFTSIKETISKIDFNSLINKFKEFVGTITDIDFNQIFFLSVVGLATLFSTTLRGIVVDGIKKALLIASTLLLDFDFIRSIAINFANGLTSYLYENLVGESKKISNTAMSNIMESMFLEAESTNEKLIPKLSRSFGNLLNAIGVGIGGTLIPSLFTDMNQAEVENAVKRYASPIGTAVALGILTIMSETFRGAAASILKFIFNIGEEGMSKRINESIGNIGTFYKRAITSSLGLAAGYSIGGIISQQLELGEGSLLDTATKIGSSLGVTIFQDMVMGITEGAGRGSMGDYLRRAVLGTLVGFSIGSISSDLVVKPLIESISGASLSADSEQFIDIASGIVTGIAYFFGEPLANDTFEYLKTKGGELISSMTSGLNKGITGKTSKASLLRDIGISLGFGALSFGIAQNIIASSGMELSPIQEAGVYAGTLIAGEFLAMLTRSLIKKIPTAAIKNLGKNFIQVVKKLLGKSFGRGLLAGVLLGYFTTFSSSIEGELRALGEQILGIKIEAGSWTEAGIFFGSIIVLGLIGGLVSVITSLGATIIAAIGSALLVAITSVPFIVFTAIGSVIAASMVQFMAKGLTGKGIIEGFMPIGSEWIGKLLDVLVMGILAGAALLLAGASWPIVIAAAIAAAIWQALLSYNVIDQAAVNAFVDWVWSSLVSGFNSIASTGREIWNYILKFDDMSWTEIGATIANDIWTGLKSLGTQISNWFKNLFSLENNNNFDPNTELGRANLRRQIREGSGLPVGPRENFATGGFVSGPGTGTSDSIPAMLSNGEFVINAKASKKFGPLLASINKGTYGRFAEGYTPGVSPSFEGSGRTYATAPTNTLEAFMSLWDGSKSKTLEELIATQKESNSETNKEILAKSEASDKTSEATDKIKELKEQLKSIAESAIELTTMSPAYFAQAGLSGAEAMLQSFKDNFSGLLKGELSFKDMIGGLLDTFTNNIIDNFVGGFTNALFNKFDLTSLFGGLFSSAAGTGAQAGGGVLAPNTSGLMQNGTPVFVTNMPMSSGAVSQNPLSEGATNGAQAGGGFFSSLFSGIQGFFGNLFGGIGNLFSGLFGSGGLGGLFSLFSGGSLFGGFATGGFVSGPGTATSDSIMAMLSNGEYVVNAATTKRWLPFLETLNANKGRLPAFANGGLVGPSNPSAFKTLQENNNNKDKQQVFNINVSGDVSMQTRKEIARMIPEITAGVNMTNRERGSR